VRARLILPVLCGCLIASSLYAQDPPTRTEPGPVLKELVLQGATVFTRDDVLWLLRLQIGERLPDQPDGIAQSVERRYGREGYTSAKVEATYDPQASRLTLTVDEGRLDDIEVVGVPPEIAARFRSELSRLHVRPGDVYNRRTVGHAVQQIIENAEGALRLGRTRGEGPDDIDIVDRGGRRVLVVPVRRERVRVSFTSGTDSREDLFNPVDGFAPGLGFHARAFDDHLNYTFIGGYVSRKFGADRNGYSLGIERALMRAPRLVIGAEIHDLTASDDLWRLTATEQSLGALAFKNTFRDYYRRQGVQAHVAIRPHMTQEFLVSWRRDTHEPLGNATNFSFFRDSHTFRANTRITGGDLRAFVFAYTADSRGLARDGIEAAFERHLADDLFRGSRRQANGWRVDWTSEIAGHGTGGTYRFDRHILNARAYIPLSPRQSIAARGLAGVSGGTLPDERRFALGGVGTVHGYGFKEAIGERMQLVNAEYRLDLAGDRHDGRPGSLRALVFFDAGRVGRPLGGSTSEWLKGLGVGIQSGGIRVEFGFRVDDIPRSHQILVRLGPTF
jgi:surface antigen Omp85-like protein/surface antigen-like variable number repeat protein